MAAIDGDGLRLAAPFAPNINHASTVFGGSASALAILSAWTLLHTRLRELPFPTEIVIQRNAVEYRLPMRGDFEALCAPPGEPEWQRFLQALTRRGKGRITLRSVLSSGGEPAGSFEGVYVATRLEEPAAR